MRTAVLDQAVRATAVRQKNVVMENWSLTCLATLDLMETQPLAALEQLRVQHATSIRIGDSLGMLNRIGLEARAYLMLGERGVARQRAEQALFLSQTLPLSFAGGLEGFMAAAEVLTTLAAEVQDRAEPRDLMRLAGQALLQAWRFAMTFPIGLPRAALITGMYARMRGQTWLARIFFEWTRSAASALSMPHEAARAQFALANLATQAT